MSGAEGRFSRNRSNLLRPAALWASVRGMTRAAWALAPLFGALLLAACATAPAPSPGGETTAGASAAAARAKPQRMASGFAPEAVLRLCPRLAVSNAPPTNGNRSVRGYAPLARINGVTLLVNPAPRSCLSSNFGRRDGRLHKGIDLQSQPPVPVVAAAPGVVVESGYRDDYGNYVLIDHGSGVFTRYAHLASIMAEARQGRAVDLGTMIGIMGNTAGYRIPVHLHYEVLTGNYATGKGAFGLTPVDILAAASAHAAS